LEIFDKWKILLVACLNKLQKALIHSYCSG